MIKARLLRSAISILMLLSFGCGKPDRRGEDEAAIRQADSSWSAAAASKEEENMTRFFLNDASFLPPHQRMVETSGAIRKVLQAMFASPGFALSWEPTKVEASRSGDIGYSIGTYQLTVDDEKGNPVTDRGKYLTIWKKQVDGSWKVAADAFNSNLTMPAK